VLVSSVQLAFRAPTRKPWEPNAQARASTVYQESFTATLARQAITAPITTSRLPSARLAGTVSQARKFAQSVQLDSCAKKPTRCRESVLKDSPLIRGLPIAMDVLKAQPVMEVHPLSAPVTRSLISLATHVSTAPKVCPAQANSGAHRFHAHQDTTRQTE